MEYELGAPGKAYSTWAAQMALGLGTGVPWVMCKQDDAPDPIVSITRPSSSSSYSRYLLQNTCHFGSVTCFVFFVFVYKRF